MKRLIMIALLASTSSFAFADEPPALKLISIEAPHHNKKLDFSVWYPGTGGTLTKFGENPVFQGVDALQDAKPTEGKYPVILMSHGLGGNFRSMAWLSAGLSQKGAIVISVNHPNSSTFDFDLSKGLQHWTRVQDLQLALDAVEHDPTWADKIDTTRIYATGFSYGGWTALSMGGLRANLAAFVAHCKAAITKSSHCGGVGKTGLEVAAQLNKMEAGPWDSSYKDQRISKVAAIDPAFTYGITGSETNELVKDILLIGLGKGEDRLFATNTGPEGSGFDSKLPNAKIEVIAPASHFTAILPCKPNGTEILAEEQDDAVCTDPVGTNRQAVHQRIVERIASFFKLK